MEITIESKRVRATICEKLTDWFEEYLSENIGEDILAAYHEGFTVDQVARDLCEAIKHWANDENNVEALTELVNECADEYLDDAEYDNE